MKSYEDDYNEWLKKNNKTQVVSNTVTETSASSKMKSYDDDYNQWLERRNERARKQQEEAQRQQEERNKQVQEAQQRAREREQELKNLNEKAKANMSSEVKDKIDKLSSRNLSKDEELKLKTELNNNRQAEITQKIVEETQGLEIIDKGKPMGHAVKASKDIYSEDASKRVPAKIRYTLDRGKQGIKNTIANFFFWLQNETAGDFEKYSNIDSNSLTSKLARATMAEEEIEEARKDYQERIKPKYIDPAIEDSKIVAGNANAEQLYQQTLPKDLRTSGQVSEGIGRMLPIIGASAINPMYGNTLMYGSTAGEESSKLIAEGEDISKSNKVGRLKGGVEVGTEYLTGGIKFRGKGALDDIAGNFIANHTKSKIGNFLATKGYQVLGEIGEEHISNIAGYGIDKMILNKDTSLKEAWEDAKETTKTTFLTTLTLNMLGLGGENYSGNTTVNQQLINEYENITNTKLNEEQKNNILNEIDEISGEINLNKQENQILPTANTFKPIIQENQVLPTAQERQGLPKANNQVQEKNTVNNSEIKEKQLDIIQKNNPMADDYHTGIRSIEDIKTFEEAMQDDESFVYGDFTKEDAEKALQEGKVTVYSSKPIKQGSFVSTSQNMAKDYAGNGKIYSQEVDLKDVAWINGDEGQYAKVENDQKTLYNNIKIGETKNIKIDEIAKLVSEGGYRTEEQINSLKEDIKKNGITTPIEIYRKNDGTIAIENGNHRLKIAQELGIKDIPVKMVESWENIGINKDVEPKIKKEVDIDYDGSNEISKTINNVNETSGYREGLLHNDNKQLEDRETTERNVNFSTKESKSNEQTSSNKNEGNNRKQIENSNESSFNLEETQPLENPTGDKSISTIATTEEQQQITKILDEPIAKQKEKSRWWAIAKANLIDKGIVFEELSHKTKNRELQGKWDYMLLSGARGQDAIGKPRYERDSKTKTEKQISKSLEDIKTEVGKNRSEFQNYMYHQLNIDRMTLKDRFGIDNKPVFGDNISAYYSKELVAEYEKNHPEFKEYAQDIYDFLDANKKELVDKGVISQELSDKLKELYPHYVPIKRVDKKGLAVKVPLDTYRTGVNSPLAKATGGSSDIEPLFQTIANRTEQTYKASARNNFGVELMNTLNSVTESSKVDVDSILEQIGDEDTELLKEGKNGENPTFTVFNNGEKVTFEITKDMYDALKPQSEVIKNINNSWLSKGINKVSNFRRGILTEYNPVFSLTNAIKDAQDVVINSQHPAKTYAKFPEAYAQIMKKGYWYNEYVANGGEQNSYFKDGEFESDKKQSKLKTAVTMPLNAISKVNNVIEMAPRLAEYIASREAGRSVEVSMLDAARVTTNFKAGGDITKTLNRNGFTFLNASVQGFQQQVRNIQEANTKGLKGYAVLATKYAIAGLPAILLNNLIWKDDEEYQNLQDYAKDNYYIVAKLGNGKFLRIPKGRVAATVQKIVSNATEYITDDKQINIDNLAKDFYEDAKFARDNVAPNNPIENNILTPIFNVAQNKTWYGSDLVPKRLQDKPKNEQYDETTDSLSIWLGDKLNQSPYKINYLLDQYGGGVADIALPRFTKQAENNMFEDKFTTDAIMKNKYPGEFYDTLDKLKTKANSSNATDEDILRYKYASSNSSKMSELYKEKRDIQNSNKSDKQKKEELKSVQQKINNLAKQNLESAKNLKISGNTATIKDNQYYKVKNVSDETMEWKKVTDKEKEQNKNISLKTYADYKNKLADETIKQRKNGVITSEEQLKNKDKINVVLNSSYSNKEKSAIYENYIGKEDDVYQILKNTDININQYLKYKEQDFAADKIDDGTLSGKSVSGSKKEKIRSYIDSMQITYMQKLMLFGSQYTLSNNEQTQIVNYIESLNKTRQEKLDILSKFKGFTIYKDGRFTY